MVIEMRLYYCEKCDKRFFTLKEAEEHENNCKKYNVNKQ